MMLVNPFLGGPRSGSFSGFTNPSFEDGTVAGWTALGSGVCTWIATTSDNGLTSRDGGYFAQQTTTQGSSTGGRRFVFDLAPDLSDAEVDAGGVLIDFAVWAGKGTVNNGTPNHRARVQGLNASGVSVGVLWDSGAFTVPLGTWEATARGFAGVALPTGARKLEIYLQTVATGGAGALAGSISWDIDYLRWSL